MDAEWIDDKPDECQLCHTKIDDSFVDGRVEGGRGWAIMCPFCALAFGVGLGTGHGQMYASENNGPFLKIRG